MNAPLDRALGLRAAIFMGLGSIIGTGVFVSLGIASDVVGSGVLLAIPIAGIVAMANGLSSAQLAAAHPVSGGTYEYGHRFIHPLAGYAAGWLFVAAKSASAATAALGCAGYLLRLFSLSPTFRTPLALGITALLTGLVALGVRKSNWANTVLVSMTLLVLVLFVISGAFSIKSLQHINSFQAEVLESPQNLFTASALMFVAFTGYGRIATLGEEVQAPRKTLPRAIVLTLLCTLVLYAAVAFISVAVMGAEDFAKATRTTGAPLEVVASFFDHAWVAPLIAIGAITALCGVLLNLLLGLSRVLLAMARRREMPSPLTHIDKNKSPTRAVLAVGMLIACLSLVGDIRLTWTFSAFTVLVYYALTNIAALRLPRELQFVHPSVSFFGLTACLSLAFCIEWQIWCWGAALILVGFAFRQLFFSSPHAR